MIDAPSKYYLYTVIYFLHSKGIGAKEIHCEINRLLFFCENTMVLCIKNLGDTMVDELMFLMKKGLYVIMQKGENDQNLSPCIAKKIILMCRDVFPQGKCPGPQLIGVLTLIIL